MNTETYWPQQQLYLFATCVLFPEKISNKYLSVLEMDEYVRHFFDKDEQLDVLTNLQSQGLLKVATKKSANDNYEFLISDINQSGFRERLLEYLGKYRNDELIADYPEKPESFNELEKRLHKYLAHTDRASPIVNTSNIWTTYSEWTATLSPFWELILASDLITGDTQIVDIGISSVKTQYNKDIERPYAELTILNKSILVKSEYNPVSNAHTALMRAEVVVARVSHNKSSVAVNLGNGERVILKESLRTDMAPYSLMDYLTENRGEDISIEDARRLQGCERITDLSEQLRQSGFDKNLKELFFEKSNKRSVQLKKEVYLTPAQIDSFKK